NLHCLSFRSFPFPYTFPPLLEGEGQGEMAPPPHFIHKTKEAALSDSLFDIFLIYGLSFCFNRFDIYIGFTSKSFRKYHTTFGKRKQRVITSDTYVLAWIMLCTSLTYDDASTFSKLSAKKLNAQALAFRVTAVLGTTYTFLMCHDTICLKVL